MTADEEDDAVRTRRRLPRVRRGGRIAAVILLLLIGVLIGAWSQRRTIATGYIDDYLAAKGVRATYGIADLGLGRQRLTNVVIGDPARPDLVADWMELRTDIGLSGANVVAVRIGRVRLRGRLVNGTLSLGALDRLMPPPSGKPFSLPALNVDVADARMRLETPNGLVGLKLSGRGRLDDGFAGTLAAVSDRLSVAGCAGDKVAAAMKVRVVTAAPSLDGPVRVDRVTCGATQVAGVGVDLKVALGAALDRWKGAARLATGGVRHPLVRAASATGWASFDGDAAATKGRVKLDSGRFVSAEGSGKRLGFGAEYTVGRTVEIAPGGYVDVEELAVTPARLAAIARLGSAGAGTPVGPIAAALAKASVAAGRSIGGAVKFGWRSGGPVRMSQIVLRSASGLDAALNDADIVYDPATGALKLVGALSLAGGGLPALEMRLAQSAPGAPVTGNASLRRPYETGGASLNFTPLRFSATPGGNSRFGTQVTLSGPLGDGRVEGLEMPVDGLWDGRGGLALNADCSAVGWRRLAVSGLDLRPASLLMCPISGALVRLDNGRLSGGARIAAPRLAGTLGSSPLTLSASGAALRLADRGFVLNGLSARLGSPERVTRLDFGSLTGRIAGASVVGAFAQGGGQIGNVPLVLSGATGNWAFRNGTLFVGSELDVGDAAPDPRFRTLRARASLTLADNRIRVSGMLTAPERNVAVSAVTILHDLRDGTGAADLIVPGLTFAEKGLQPDDLTRLTVGVVANVVGTVTGEGHIRWNPDGVTSDGVFRTANTDLAAALGPVTGIATEIRFTDLLNLRSAPGQVATIKTINTGIVVNDGMIRYQTLPNARVKVESGRWPFAGGSVVLEPTLLDFSESQERRMTLSVTGMEAAKFLAQFEFDNLNATGVFDGRMPMVFDPNGGRIVDGRLTVRPGGGTIAYMGEVSKENIGVWGNLAFQALRSLRYQNLELVMNGPLSGEMVTELRFAGVGQGEGAKRNFILDRLQRLPFVFNVKIKAPFRGLFDSARSFYDPSRLVERNLPALMEERDRLRAPAKPVQPQESETAP